MKKIISGLSIALFAFTLTGFYSPASAATYMYVNTSGNIQTVEANSAEQALAVAPNRMSNSGVMLQTNSSPVVTNPTSPLPTTTGPNTYVYVNTSGQVLYVNASSPEEAFRRAVGIDQHSGVMKVS